MIWIVWALIIAALFYSLLLLARAFVSRRMAKMLNETWERHRK